MEDSPGSSLKDKFSDLRLPAEVIDRLSVLEGSDVVCNSITSCMLLDLHNPTVPLKDRTAVLNAYRRQGKTTTATVCAISFIDKRVTDSYQVLYICSSRSVAKRVEESINSLINRHTKGEETQEKKADSSKGGVKVLALKDIVKMIDKKRDVEWMRNLKLLVLDDLEWMRNLKLLVLDDFECVGDQKLLILERAIPESCLIMTTCTDPNAVPQHDPTWETVCSVINSSMSEKENK